MIAMNNREQFKRVLEETYPGRYDIIDCGTYLKVFTKGQPEGIYKGTDYIFSPAPVFFLSEGLRLASLIAVENGNPYILIS